MAKNATQGQQPSVNPNPNNQAFNTSGMYGTPAGQSVYTGQTPITPTTTPAQVANNVAAATAAQNAVRQMSPYAQAGGAMIGNRFQRPWRFQAPNQATPTSGPTNPNNPPPQSSTPAQNAVTNATSNMGNGNTGINPQGTPWNVGNGPMAPSNNMMQFLMAMMMQNYMRQLMGGGGTQSNG